MQYPVSCFPFFFFFYLNSIAWLKFIDFVWIRYMSCFIVHTYHCYPKIVKWYQLVEALFHFRSCHAIDLSFRIALANFGSFCCSKSESVWFVFVADYAKDGVIVHSIVYTYAIAMSQMAKPEKVVPWEKSGLSVIYWGIFCSVSVLWITLSVCRTVWMFTYITSISSSFW